MKTLKRYSPTVIFHWTHCTSRDVYRGSQVVVLLLDQLLEILLNGVTSNVWLLNWECSIVEKFFRNHLKPIRLFYSAYLFSKSTNSIFKILIDCWLLRDDFENRLLKNYSIKMTKNVVKICLKPILKIIPQN